MNKWNYGDAFIRYPLTDEPYCFPDGSIIKVHDIMTGIPDFMKTADLIFVDPPWNKGNLNSFYTKAEIIDRLDSYESFYHQLFYCIQLIKPSVCYIEIGKEYLADFIIEMKKLYKYVTFYNSTYYHDKKKLCYVIRGANKSKKPSLDGIDEEDIIKWVCENETYNCIGDLCMGKGLVGYHAFLNKKTFVGTELNHKRLAVLVEKVQTYTEAI